MGPSKMMYKSFMIAVFAPFAQLHCSKDKEPEVVKCKAEDSTNAAKLKFKTKTEPENREFEHGTTITVDLCEKLYNHSTWDKTKFTKDAKVECKKNKNTNILSECVLAKK